MRGINSVRLAALIPHGPESKNERIKNRKNSKKKNLKKNREKNVKNLEKSCNSGIAIKKIAELVIESPIPAIPELLRIPELHTPAE